MKLSRQWIGAIAVLVIASAVMMRFSVENGTAKTPLQTALFAVERLTCGACSDTIRDELFRVDGVDDVQVDVGRGLSRVRFDPSSTNPAQLAAAITAAGYPARPVAEADLPAGNSQVSSGGCSGGCCSGRKS